MHDYFNWLLPFDFSPERTSEYAGFVYRITNKQTGRAYIGRKYFWARRGKKTIPSKWENYWGSCKELTADVASLGKDQFERRILQVFKTRSEVDYEEVAEQFRCDVLKAVLPNGERAFYNANIMSRYFYKHGTKRRGKLSDDDIRAIRSDKRTHNVIAQHYGVSTPYISLIRNRKTHQHVE